MEEYLPDPAVTALVIAGVLLLLGWLLDDVKQWWRQRKIGRDPLPPKALSPPPPSRSRRITLD